MPPPFCQGGFYGETTKRFGRRFLTGRVSSPACNAKAVLAENDRLGGDLNSAQELFYGAVIILQVLATFEVRIRSPGQRRTITRL